MSFATDPRGLICVFRATCFRFPKSLSFPPFARPPEPVKLVMSDLQRCASKWFAAAIAVSAAISAVSAVAQTTPSRPNVLFIAVDDLRPELNCYGRSHIRSPNIDSLAAEGVVFERAYCMVPTCGASRASLMTGLRPSRHRFVNYLTRADKDVRGTTTLNTHFKNHDYYTVSDGKVFHHAADNVAGWSEKPWRPRGGGYQLAENRQLHGRVGPRGKKLRGPAYEAADVDDDQYTDGMIAEKAISDLKRLTQDEQPFFLAVGFMKPHLPFVAPQKYWDLYNRDDIQLPPNYQLPKNAPSEAVHNSGELRAYHGIPAKGAVSDETARAMIHGYYACVSFVDAQIGRVLDELERLGVADKTVVVLWGDHGWNLGDHTMWCKHSCFESSLHAPLVFRGPGVPEGQRRANLVEFIDIYPTLCDLSGLEPPDHLHGSSLVPLMRDADSEWKDAAVSRFRTGDTIRTDRFRFTKYSTEKGNPTGRMMYDHVADPLENTNVAQQPTQRDTVKSHDKALEEQMGRD